MTDFILGFYVDRLDTKADPHIVWAGFTEAEREAHKEWIQKNLPQPPVNFHDTQAPVVITEPGRYLQANGKIFRVAQILGVMAYGYGQKPHPAYSDRLIDSPKPTWVYLDGNRMYEPEPANQLVRRY